MQDSHRGGPPAAWAVFEEVIEMFAAAVLPPVPAQTTQRQAVDASTSPYRP